MRYIVSVKYKPLIILYIDYMLKSVLDTLGPIKYIKLFHQLYLLSKVDTRKFKMRNVAFIMLLLDHPTLSRQVHEGRRLVCFVYHIILMPAPESMLLKYF